MIFASFVDNFLVYLAELLSLIYRSRPSILKSGDKVKTELILEFRSMKKLIDALAERKVNELSYQGMNELNNVLAKQMKLNLFENKGELQKAIEIIEKRNLITHNRAIVNSVFLRKTSGSSYKLNDRLIFDSQSIIDLFGFLVSAAKQIDNKAVKKFKLKAEHTYDDIQEGPFIRGLMKSAEKKKEKESQLQK